MAGFGKHPHRVFEVPELVGLICRYSHYQTQARMLQVSRFFFNSAASGVWENVVGVHNLLQLLPGVTIRPPSPGRRNMELLLDISSTTSFERFDLYAQFVKHLEIYSFTMKVSDQDYNVSGWAGLTGQAKRRVLLPKLLRLTISSGTPVSSKNQFLWIRMFMSPSVDTVQVLPPPDPGSLHYIYPLMATTLVRYLASNCPNIHTLSLFPSKLHTMELGDEYTAIEVWEPSFYDRLALLPLRNLTCTSDIFASNIFPILNQLPLLERLSVECCSDELSLEIASSGLESPPPLRHLVLKFEGWTKVMQVFELNIFSRLTSLAIFLDEVRPNGVDVENLWGAGLMSHISRCSPALTNLEIDFGLNMLFSLTSTSILHPLAALPLRSISLKNLFRVRDSVLADLHTIWPLAIKIEFHGLSFTLAHLYHFSRFSYLEHLVAGFFIEEIPEEMGSAPTISTSFRILESPDTVEMPVDLLPLARHFLSFWPNLQRVVWPPDEGGDVYARPYRMDAVIMNALNALIGMHRATLSSG